MVDPVSFSLARRASDHGPLILMYHSISRTASPVWPWAVSLDSFEKQLDLLAALGYRTATMGDIASSVRVHTSRTVVITFDDGYEDNMLAVDVLLRRGMTATWFIVTDAIGAPPSWPYDGRPDGRMLDAAELRAMHTSGIEIGSHTASHCRLTQTDDRRLVYELTASKTALEQILGTEVGSFAYPYGDWDERCAQAVAEAGYRQACTTRTGWALRDGNPYTLRRLTVFNHDTASSLCRKLVLAHNDGSFRALADYLGNRVYARLRGSAGRAGG